MLVSQLKIKSRTLHSFENTESFLVHNVDILSDIDLHKMYAMHSLNKNDITLAVRKRRTNRYLYFNRQHLLRGWTSEKEKKSIWIK